MGKTEIRFPKRRGRQREDDLEKRTDEGTRRPPLHGPRPTGAARAAPATAASCGLPVSQASRTGTRAREGQRPREQMSRRRAALLRLAHGAPRLLKQARSFSPGGQRHAAPVRGGRRDFAEPAALTELALAPRAPWVSPGRPPLAQGGSLLC